MPHGRLITLTGPGGTGKTRLALAVAEKLRDGDGTPVFGDGIWFVDLSAITDPALVVPAIVYVLSPPGDQSPPTLERLCARLGAGRMLLVLDNFEQVLDGAVVVSEILAACPNVAVLATSREPLHVRWEQQWPVRPLDLPALEANPCVDELAGNPAVQLFTERARAVAPDFALRTEDAHRVAEICVRLDGLPLAIELIAARVRALSLQSIQARLHQALDLASAHSADRPQRQRTLRDAIAWSHDLLDDTQRMVFRRLAVFAGGCTLESAAAICESEGLDGERRILDVLTSLIDKQLVRHTVEPGGRSRYRMLETIRAFAHERLVASGEIEQVRGRHAAYLLRYATQALEGQEPLANRSENGLDEELDNFRAALQWTLDGATREPGCV